MQHRRDDAAGFLDFLGFPDHHGDRRFRMDHGAPAARRSRAFLRQERKRVATMAAELAVWADRRLLGIPHVRWLIVDRATYMALGLDFQVKGADPAEWGLHPDSLAVALDAIETAKLAAEKSIATFDQSRSLSAH